MYITLYFARTILFHIREKLFCISNKYFIDLCELNLHFKNGNQNWKYSLTLLIKAQLVFYRRMYVSVSSFKIFFTRFSDAKLYQVFKNKQTRKIP